MELQRELEFNIDNAPQSKCFYSVWRWMREDNISQLFFASAKNFSKGASS